MPKKQRMESIISNSVKETQQFAKKIAEETQKYRFICLRGDLGAGKTTFVKGFVEAFGINKEQVKSPTYTYLKEYDIGKKKLYHFDFYRLEQLDDLMAHDLSEIFMKRNTIFLMEWAERIEQILPNKRIDIQIEYINENTRKLTKIYAH